MHQNTIPNSMPSIEKIIRRIQSAEKSNQKEVRIEISEARDLVRDLALITSNLALTIDNINKSLQNIQQVSKEVDIKFDGGGF